MPRADRRTALDVTRWQMARRFIRRSVARSIADGSNAGSRKGNRSDRVWLEMERTNLPRVCNREGCGKRIVAKDGSPDYRKHFCGAVCLRIDKRERLVAKRERIRGRRCPQCGRRPAFAVIPAVSSEPVGSSESSCDGGVKLHTATANEPVNVVDT